MPAVALSKIALTDAKMSSRWARRFKGIWLSAENALDAATNTMAHTKGGKGHWWSAQFEAGSKEVTEVRITNRLDCCGDRLAGTTVYVGDTLCGTVEDNTVNGAIYTVTCAAPLTGNQVTIRKENTYTHLQLALVEVYGNDNCTHDERLNAQGPHKCGTSLDCSGKRTCSRWGWCQGTSECPA